MVDVVASILYQVVIKIGDDCLGFSYQGQVIAHKIKVNSLLEVLKMAHILHLAYPRIW